jgi:hypothetical protein
MKVEETWLSHDLIEHRATIATGTGFVLQAILKCMPNRAASTYMTEEIEVLPM